ncbi:MAG TPA: DUF4416 family protein [Syntrophorhabdaceae bacterium]|nr:DUF4416 family protein [Syntrophorhabdaceae bacterium]HPU29923.1 DUF4416 family protein [Syntrophorhabdaceae bacterium]
MGNIKQPKPVALFASIIYKNEGILTEVLKTLEEKIGIIEDRTHIMAFNHTDYYEREMGSGLNRIFILFNNLIERESLVNIKLKTNEIEKYFSIKEKRHVNIDPGYVSLENIVLATTKNYTHRIYLGSGIYGDLTLIYKKGTYNPLEWTYPDYASNDIITIFNKWRNLYKRKLT